VAADPLALTILRAPGEAGADVVFGSTGRFGLPLGYGGPHAAYLAARQDLLRQLPGRLVGLSKDADGAPALRLALQTREQHIRRERATSNICTAQVLPAVMAALYAMWHGPEGLAGMALEIHAQAGALAAALRAAGMEVALGFDMVYARVPGRAAELKAAARAAGYAIWQDGPDGLGIAFDETTGPADVAAVARALGAPERSAWAEAAAEARALADSQVAATEASVVAKALAASGAQIPPGLARTAPCLRHRVFHRYRTETAMMRYLRRLADRDYALDRGMIPLGSCTMKLNAAAEMETLGAATFADLHPFLDAADAAGALALIADLEAWLAQATGYDAVSLQPNAGSQGELAGLLAIRRYHAARGQGGRDICLIPASAHGTNAASAGLAGLRVVGVATAPDGSVDESDLASKLAEHGSQTAAIMLTYPSTHGVYEPGLRSVCAAAHAAGAQVYIDGANFNALVGWAKAGELGGDVSHLNLHKTFAMPHGGGGPGIGPVAAKAHLAPYLPGHPQAPEGRKDHPLTAAPFGSPLLLPIAWAYIHMMGAEGLAAATEGAVAGANYIARRLDHVFPVLYRGPGGFVAHECILDVRPLTARTGVSVDDVAKRLIDYGFHAPTMSFPVAGTLMVEPTESESLAELERFCAAMEAIAAEAESWAGAGLLAAAPHTALSVSDDEWSAPYPRRLAGYPAGPDPDRYWPPVRRVDGPYGDRHPVLTWPDEHDTPES
jgi:glycine dehydrogenase